MSGKNAPRQGRREGMAPPFPSSHSSLVRKGRTLLCPHPVPAAHHWIHNLDPDLIRFSDSIAIRWYGMAYIAGFVVAAWLLKVYHRKGLSPLDADQQSNLCLWLFGGVFLGGRLGSMFLYSWHEFMADPLRILRVWEGGMASHGGFVGVALGLFFFCRKEKMPYRRFGDIVVTLAPAGLLFGRVANFINGELWGKVTKVSWAVIFPRSADPSLPVPSGSPLYETAIQAALQNGHLLARHPSQLYAAFLEGLVLLVWSQWRFWQTDVTQKHPGRLSGEFLMLYAVLRAIGEIFREPDAELILGLSRGTFYSLFLLLGGLILVVTGRPKQAGMTNDK